MMGRKKVIVSFSGKKDSTASIILLKQAIENEGADFYATGHYTDKVSINGPFMLKEPLGCMFPWPLSFKNELKNR